MNRSGVLSPKKMSSLNNRDITKTLGAKIAAKRVKLGISQDIVAERAQISRSYYSDVERGLRNISISSLCSIAAALGTSGSELLLEAERAANGDGLAMAASHIEVVMEPAHDGAGEP